jgi:hypothetical protein
MKTAQCIAALLALMSSSAALAQPETMMCGEDSSQVTRRLLTDSSGRIITSSSSGGGQQYTNGDVVAAPVGPMCMGWSGTAANALKVDSNGNLQVNMNTLIAGENLDAGYTVVHLDSTSAMAANQSVNVSQINGVTTLMGNGVTGTGSQRVTIASDNTAFSVNATCSQGTAASLKSEAVGTKTVNAAVPGATNFGVLPAVANAQPGSWTETYQTALSVDLSGNLRVAGVKTNDNGVPGATNLGVLPAVATTSAPSYSDTRQTALSVDLFGQQRTLPPPMNLDMAVVADYTACAAGGCVQTDGGTPIAAGAYFVTVTSENMTLCYAATCATGGRTMPVGRYNIRLPADTNVSWRSTSGTGNAQFTHLVQ